ncbi:MAG: FadR/GntR family transcriptional regulator [Candidatus Dormibacteria bacterium]
MVGSPRPRSAPTVAAGGDGVFSPVRAGNAFEETVEHLLGAIRLGRVRPGDRLPPQRELASRLHVSRVTLREALRSLEEAGYVRTSRGRRGGTLVVQTSGAAAAPRPAAIPAETAPALSDALAFRFALEPAAASLAAGRPVSAAEAARLRRDLEAVSAAPPAGYRQADSHLHTAIAELSGSPSLASAIGEVRLRINDLLDAMPLLPPNLEHSTRQHVQIVDAVLAGDPTAARTAMEEHLAATGALLRGFLG